MLSSKDSRKPILDYSAASATWPHKTLVTYSYIRWEHMHAYVSVHVLAFERQRPALRVFVKEQVVESEPSLLRWEWLLPSGSGTKALCNGQMAPALRSDHCVQWPLYAQPVSWSSWLHAHLRCSLALRTECMHVRCSCITPQIYRAHRERFMAPYPRGPGRAAACPIEVPDCILPPPSCRCWSRSSHSFLKVLLWYAAIRSARRVVGSFRRAQRLRANFV
jgi:hypothetical protein